jgi:hypothetical protein
MLISSMAISSEILQLWTREKVTLLNVFDNIPTDTKMAGCVLNGHMPGQLQCIAFKSFCVASAAISKPGFHLSDDTADQAWLYATESQTGLLPIGNERNLLLTTASANDIARLARRALQFKRFMTYGKGHSATRIFRINVVIVMDTKSMIQETCGHEKILLFL